MDAFPTSHPSKSLVLICSTDFGRTDLDLKNARQFTKLRFTVGWHIHLCILIFGLQVLGAWKK